MCIFYKTTKFQRVCLFHCVLGCNNFSPAFLSFSLSLNLFSMFYIYSFSFFYETYRYVSCNMGGMQQLLSRKQAQSANNKAFRVSRQCNTRVLVHFMPFICKQKLEISVWLEKIETEVGIFPGGTKINKICLKHTTSFNFSLFEKLPDFFGC